MAFVILSGQYSHVITRTRGPEQQCDKGYAMARLRTSTRTLHNAGIRRVIGHIYSHKNGRAVPWESQLERDFYYECEFRTDIRAYRPQPRQLTFWFDGRSALYTPDAEVTFDDGTIWYCETKPSAKVVKDDMRQRLRAIERAVSEQGYSFWLVTDTDLRRGHRPHNLRLLYRYVVWPREEDAAAAVAETMMPGTLSPIADVATAFRDWALDVGHVYQALFKQTLHCELEADPINPQTMVWRPAR